MNLPLIFINFTSYPSKYKQDKQDDPSYVLPLTAGQLKLALVRVQGISGEEHVSANHRHLASVKTINSISETAWYSKLAQCRLPLWKYIFLNNCFQSFALETWNLVWLICIVIVKLMVKVKTFSSRLSDNNYWAKLFTDMLCLNLCMVGRYNAINHYVKNNWEGNSNSPRMLLLGKLTLVTICCGVLVV